MLGPAGRICRSFCVEGQRDESLRMAAENHVQSVVFYPAY